MTEMLINGVPASRLPADDRGLLYGDGLFETIAFYGGSSPLWPLHMDRLGRGCAVLDLPVPNPGVLLEEARRLIAARGREVVRITLTRGSGGRAYFPPEPVSPNRILMRQEFPNDLEDQWQHGIRAVTSPIVLEGPPMLAGLKHLNRLAQVQIARHCHGKGAREALVADRHGRLVEALTGNLVVVRDSRMLTPAAHDAAVAGVGLAWLKEQVGTALEAVELPVAALGPEDEIWVINSVSGIRPVSRLDGLVRPIGSACRAWQERWQQLIGTPS